jgi:hypothetical protein
MKRAYAPVNSSLFLNEREKWLREIRRGENVSVVFFPKTDRFRRLHQLLEDKEYLRNFFGTGRKYLFQYTDFVISPVEDKTDIQDHIARQFNDSNLTNNPRTFFQWLAYFSKEHIHVVLMLADAEKYLTPGYKHIPPLLFEITMDFAPTITLMNFFETDITHPSYSSILTLSKELYENLYWYPLYSEDDTRVFIRYVKNKWDMTISEKLEDTIIESCGGHLWFVKEAIREQLNRGKFSLDNDAFFFRMDTVYRSLQQSEQKVLEKIVSRQNQFSEEERHSLIYLNKMNVVSKNNHLEIGLMGQYIGMRPHEDQHIEIHDGRVFINNITVDSIFTRKEHRVLMTLLEHRGEIVSRDMIAQSIWPSRTDQQYSDWAIDQLITRLRKRLLELSLAPEIVHVVRGKGYRLNH